MITPRVSWNSHAYTTPKPKPKAVGKFTMQKLLGNEWVTTGHASNMDAAERHSLAVGGQVRAVDRNDNVVEVWDSE